MQRARPLVILLVVVVLIVWYQWAHTKHHRPGVLEGSGTIEATQVDLAPKVAGRITTLKAKEGDTVKAGQVLVELDGVELQEQLEQAQANLTEAQARARSAEAQLKLERDQYAASVQQARASADTNEARVPQAGENLRMQSGLVAAQIQQVQAQVSSAQANLAAARGNVAAGEQAVRAAQANLRTAQANLVRAQQDADRYEKLYGQDAISTQQRDTARTTLEAAQGARDAAAAQVEVATAQRDAARDQERSAASAVDQSRAALAQAQANAHTVPMRQYDVQASQAQLEQAQAGVRVAEAARARVLQREHDLAAARAAEKQAEAALRLAQTNRDNAELKAPFDATVLSKNFEVGDLVAVGSPTITLADMAHPYLRVFVSETEMARVKLGQKAQVEVDALPGRTFDGVVDEIREKAEYIPGNVQTKDERAKLVFGVRLRLDNPDGSLKPGLPADATIQAP